MPAKEKKAKIGILGASGYTGAELVRLLLRHPLVEIALLTADRRAGSLDTLGRLMLALGRAVMTRPTLLLVDQPCRGLDAAAGEVDAEQVLACMGTDTATRGRGDAASVSEGGAA